MIEDRLNLVLWVEVEPEVGGEEALLIVDRPVSDVALGLRVLASEVSKFVAWNVALS